MEAAVILNQSKSDRDQVDAALAGARVTATVDAVDGDRIADRAKAAVEGGAKLVVIGGGDGTSAQVVASTGGTLALLLAAEFPKDVAAVINLSPNIAINEAMIGLLDEPWGIYMARLVKGSKYNEYVPENPEKARYWYTKYRLEAVVELENLVDHTMRPELFKKVRQPVLNLYYYKK